MTAAKIDRLCKRCNTVKTVGEFGDNKSKESKKQLWCKDCTNAYYRNYATSFSSRACVLNFPFLSRTNPRPIFLA